ncbi:MAG: hypothetical protein HKP53_01790 [Eudoraea sp.]|nr:hypothetical protein [Eudoraea sp.]
MANHSENSNNHRELKLSDRYFVLTEYESEPANFIRTVGGFYTADADSLYVTLEFDSDFTDDSPRKVHYAFELNDGSLLLNGDDNYLFRPEKEQGQALDGAWLFATRGPDTGQDRRGDSTPRKTLKFLMDGHFQWIAYNTETMKFSGTGGGSYTSNDGTYTETIIYFSRDNSRVGAVLGFTYELKGKDWHHTGKNSRGEPMYEIWALRE